MTGSQYSKKTEERHWEGIPGWDVHMNGFTLECVCMCVWSDGPEAVRAAEWWRCPHAVAMLLYGGGPCFTGTPTPSS